MNKLEKPIKSDLLLAYEKLDPQVQFYLSHHPSPAKVARAKIAAFKDDAQIDYDEIEFLIRRVLQSKLTMGESYSSSIAKYFKDRNESRTVLKLITKP